MKQTEINGCARTADCRHLISVWKQHRSRPFPCGMVTNTKNLLPLWRSKRSMIAKYWFRKLKNVLLSTTVLWKNSVIRFSKTLWGEVCEAVVSEWSQLDGPEKPEKGKQCCFSIYLIQLHRFTLICCKIQRYLTLQRKLTLAESYDFLVVVNKGQYFLKVCQIPNHTLSYCQGTAPCGDVKYLAK
jgi:hypothetical protein